MATKTATKTATKSKNTQNNSQTTEKKQRKTIKQWAGEISEANNVGFSHGYYAVEDLPKAKGARTAAKVGFNNGMKARKQADRNLERANKYRK